MESNPLLDIVKFASIENENLLVSFANNKEELALLSHVQGSYEAALAYSQAEENELVIFQLLVFIHYHFLFSNVCLMRCHLSDAFASARAAIDAGLIATVIIGDPSKQVEYANRKPPFDGQLNRHLKNLIGAKKPLPHKLVPELLNLHGMCSMFASHADIGSFVHRVTIDKTNPQHDLMSFQYFQFAENKAEQKIHHLTLLHVYVMLLDIFSPFFVTKKKLLPASWHDELQKLGAHIEQSTKAHRIKLEKEPPLK